MFPSEANKIFTRKEILFMTKLGNLFIKLFNHAVIHIYI